MFVRRLRAVALAATASLAASACYYDDYGYGGLSVGVGGGGYYGDPYGGYYDPYYGGGYYGHPGYGWYDGFYYPGSGYYIYDRVGNRHRWNDRHRRYWEGRGYTLRDREDVRDYRRFRREGRQDWRDYRRERREDRRAFRDGEVSREQFREDRRMDRREFRQDRRQDRREFRRDLRDRNDGRRGASIGSEGGQRTLQDNAPRNRFEVPR